MRVAILGADHWHWPLYEDAIRQAQVDVVGISAHNEELRHRLASLFICPSFLADRELIDAVRFEFAFVFGTPQSMPATARLLIDQGISFSIEKPVALDAANRSEMLELVKARSLFVSVPLVYRMTPLPKLLDRFIAQHGDLAHLSIRCFAGPPSRYLDNGCGWMVDPTLSGGGSTINLAPHYVDLFLARTTEPITSIFASMNNGAYGFDVEDYSNVLLRTETGTIASIETGYNFPVQYGTRDFSLVASTRSAFIRSSESTVEILDRRGATIERNDWDIDSNAAFGPYVVDALTRFKNGKPPVIGFEEFISVMKMIDAAYEAQRTGIPVFL